jgi:hypothetical protein
MDFSTNRPDFAQVPTSAGRGDTPQRSTFFQQLTGFGPVERAKSTEKKRLKKQHESERYAFRKEKRRRERDDVRTIRDSQERFFRNLGLHEFAESLPTKEEVKEQGLQDVVRKFERQQESLYKSFRERERKMERGLQKQQRESRSNLYVKFREQGPGAASQKPRTRSFLDHLAA